MKNLGNTLYGTGMRDDWMDPYARYLSKYLKAYADEGLRVGCIAVNIMKL